MSYSLSKQLPLCSIERALLIEIENYVQRKTKEIVSYDDTLDEDRKKQEYIYQRYEYDFSIKDSIGIENLKSVEEFQWPHFPDDTKQLRIKCRASREEISFSVEITFSSMRELTKVEAQFDGSSAREVTTGIADHLIAILKNYESGNRWLHPSIGWGVFLITVGFFSSLFSSLPILANWLRIFSLLPALILLISFPFVFLLPYSVFETKKNIRRQGRIKWLLLGMLSFIIFTVFGVYIRQKLLGF
jgi:hypothetical protein